MSSYKDVTFYSSYGVCLNVRGEGINNGESLKASFY